MNVVSLLPVIAAVFLFAGFIPLLYRMIKNKHSKGASTWMVILGFLQCLFYVIHDVYFQRYAMIFPFLVLGFMYFLTFILILVYRGNTANG